MVHAASAPTYAANNRASPIIRSLVLPCHSWRESFRRTPGAGEFLLLHVVLRLFHVVLRLFYDADRVVGLYRMW